jgi:hypothetical protein
MKIPFCKRNCDGVDAAAAAALVCAISFAVTFFWQASAGAVRGDASYLEELHRQIGQKIMKERDQISHLLVLEEEGDTTAPVWQDLISSYDSYEGNSQFHLIAGAVYAREDRHLAKALREYRLALEMNREYADRRSPWYRGEELEPLTAKAKKLIRPGGGPVSRAAAKAARQDLFYIERSLAGGCH